LHSVIVDFSKKFSNSLVLRDVLGVLDVNDLGVLLQKVLESGTMREGFSLLH